MQVYGRNFGPLGSHVDAFYAVGMSAETAVAPEFDESLYPAPNMTGALPCSSRLLMILTVCLLCVTDTELNVYGEDGDSVMFPALDCVVAEAHLVLNCTTAPGAGTGMSWVVSIGDQTSQAPVTGYAGPTIALAVLVNGTLLTLLV